MTETGTLRTAAMEALRVAESDPGKSVVAATALARRARVVGEFGAAARAECALGIAALHLENTDNAVRHLRAAAALGRRAGDAQIAVEARLRLAGVLNVAGRPVPALREIDGVVAESAGIDRARALAQKGAILLQLGRLDPGLEALEAAAPVLRAAGDLMWLKRLLANRGLGHARRFRFAMAKADLTEALRLNNELGIELSVAFIEQNLGWVDTLRGDIPNALQHLDRAEETLRRLGAQVGFLLEDRANLLVSVGLVAEARTIAREAATALEREGQRISLPDVRLLLARIALLDGDPESATMSARRAVREFARLGRSRGQALAHFLVLAGRAAGQDRSRVSLRALRRAADALDSAGWRADAIEARLLLAELEAERGSGDQGSSQLALASTGRRRGPAATRAAAWHAEARLRWQNGRRRGALSAVRAGLRVLDEHRSGLGAADLRAHSAVHRIGLATLGLRIAIEGGRPDAILTWAEYGRASHLLLPPLLPPDDDELAIHLADLRLVVADVNAAVTAGRDSATAVGRQLAAERRIRDMSRRRPGVVGLPTTPIELSPLSSALGSRALVEYVELDGALFALAIADGQAHWRTLGPIEPLRALVDRLSFALHRLATGANDPAAIRRLLRDATTRLNAQLLAPLADAVGDRPLIVVPTGPLQSLPWSTLPSCTQRPVTVAPSATTWHAASLAAPLSGRTVVVAGPGLPGALREAQSIAQMYGVSALSGPDATVRAVQGALAGADVAHLATHGRVRAEHPLFSSLQLTDGPMTGYDLQQLTPVPRLVVLAGCNTGRDAVVAGEELLGLTATLLAHGARQVIATVVPIPDTDTEPVMTAFHAQLLAGESAASALALAQAAADGDTLPAAAGFVCIGGGFDLTG
ncbi:CHAT domain-containing protein [Nakamurella sp. GG22]